MPSFFLFFFFLFFSFPLLESTLLHWPEILVLDPNWLIKAFYRVWRVSGISGRLRDIDESEEQFPTPLRDPPSRNPPRPSPPAARHLRHRSWSLAGTCSHPSLSALESRLGPGTRPPPAQGRMEMQSPGLPVPAVETGRLEGLGWGREPAASVCYFVCAWFSLKTVHLILDCQIYWQKNLHFPIIS